MVKLFKNKDVKKTLIILTLVLSLSLIGCTDKDGAEKALKHAGYTPIEVGGYSWLDSSEDTFKTEFTAISVNGKDTVTGVVTSGWFKGSTIRLDD